MNNSYFKLVLFFFISILLLSPIMIIIINGLSSISSAQNLYTSRYILGSSKIVLLVSIFILMISVPLAWFNTMTDYPGRKIIQILSILPLGVPAYISAYTYAELLEPGGYLKYFFISVFNFFINSVPGVILVELQFIVFCILFFFSDEQFSYI